MELIISIIACNYGLKLFLAIISWNYCLQLLLAIIACNYGLTIIIACNYFLELLLQISREQIFHLTIAKKRSNLGISMEKNVAFVYNLRKIISYFHF